MPCFSLSLFLCLSQAHAHAHTVVLYGTVSMEHKIMEDLTFTITKNLKKCFRRSLSCYIKRLVVLPSQIL
ncbi:hypothetical protein ACB094_08G133800 [Castanea mollissima]